MNKFISSLRQIINVERLFVRIVLLQYAISLFSAYTQFYIVLGIVIATLIYSFLQESLVGAEHTQGVGAGCILLPIAVVIGIITFILVKGSDSTLVDVIVLSVFVFVILMLMARDPEDKEFEQSQAEWGQLVFSIKRLITRPFG